MGRLPKPLAALRDGGEENLALALDEQDIGRRSLSEVVAIYEALQSGTLTAQMVIKHYRTCQAQLALDEKDERIGKEEINRNITCLVNEREPLHKQRLPQQALSV